MSDQLKAYMIELATDVTCLTEFMFNPKQAMETAGLDADEQAIITSGDQARIYATLKGLPLPDPAPAPAPPQLPTVVSVMPQDGSTPQAAAQLAAQPAVQAPAPVMAYAATPYVSIGYPPYYAMIWPTWTIQY